MSVEDYILHFADEIDMLTRVLKKRYYTNQPILDDDGNHIPLDTIEDVQRFLEGEFYSFLDAIKETY